MSEWFTREITDTGRLRLFCFFVFFLGAFLFIRFSVRMIRKQVKWWPGNVTPGGHHIHHAVFGTVFMCVGGISGLAVQDSRSFWAAAAASLFGIGTALVLDEFALILHLDDVYWTEQGRLSVDVIFVATALCGLALVGLRPMQIDAFVENDRESFVLLNIALSLVLNLGIAVIALLKGKIWLGLVGLFIGIFAYVGAIRLARPASPWARWRYKEGSRKLRRATEREQRRRRRLIRRLKVQLEDLIAGRPSPPGGQGTCPGTADEQGSSEEELAGSPPR